MPALRTPKPQFMHKHLFIVTGPAGSGKTTVAQQLSRTFDLPFLEGDDVSFHNSLNILNTELTLSLVSFIRKRSKDEEWEPAY